MSAKTPDHVPCRHCGAPISWDEYCWTHDDTGFADCGTVIQGHRQNVGDIDIILDPDISVEGPHKGKTALPIGDWE